VEARQVSSAALCFDSSKEIGPTIPSSLPPPAAHAPSLAHLLLLPIFTPPPTAHSAVTLAKPPTSSHAVEEPWGPSGRGTQGSPLAPTPSPRPLKFQNGCYVSLLRTARSLLRSRAEGALRFPLEFALTYA